MRICVFCGSNDGVREAYRAAAHQLGVQLAREGHVLVYGGAAVGLMGTVADAVLAGSGRVVGVIPRFLNAAGLEVVHHNLSELIVVETLHERKAAMTARADAFVVLPGGFGTLDELFETLTWAQLGLHSSPTFLINVEGFFDPLLRMIDNTIDAGFLREAHRGLFRVVNDVADLPQAIATFTPSKVQPKWLDKQ